MDSLGMGGGSKEPRHLVVAFLIGLLGEGEVLAIRLRLAGEGCLEILHGLGHLTIRRCASWIA